MTDHRTADAGTDADPTDSRDETFDERMDRNWAEILQELRVTQTGTQILTGFLLTVAFQPKFGDLTLFQERVYLVLVITAVLTTALALAPVGLHRGLFRQHAKATIVQTAHVILLMALVGVGIVLIGTVLLIFDLVVGRVAAYIVSGLTMLVVIIIGALPLVLRSYRPEQLEPDQSKIG
jgi:Family of unknown function (DUF6328)